MSGWVAGAVVVGAVVGAAASSSAASKQAAASDRAAALSAASAKDATQLQGTMYDQTRADQQPWRLTGQDSLNKLSSLLGVGQGFNTGKVGSQLVTNDNFDSAAYLSANPDVAADPTYANDPYAHFLKYGQSQGRQEIAPIYTKDSTGQPGGYGSLLKNFSIADYEADPGYAFRVSEGQKALERSAASRGGLYSGRAAKDLTRFGQDQGSQEYQNAFNRYQSNQNNQFNRLASLAGVGQTANNALATAGTNYANSVSNIGMTNSANQGNAALAAGNARASGYTGVANSLGSVNWGQVGKSFGGSSNGYGGSYPDTYAASQGQLYGPPQQ